MVILTGGRIEVRVKLNTGAYVSVFYYFTLPDELLWVSRLCFCFLMGVQTLIELLWVSRLYLIRLYLMGVQTLLSRLYCFFDGCPDFVDGCPDFVPLLMGVQTLFLDFDGCPDFVPFLMLDFVDFDGCPDFVPLILMGVQTLFQTLFMTDQFRVNRKFATVACFWRKNIVTLCFLRCFICTNSPPKEIIYHHNPRRSHSSSSPRYRQGSIHWS